MNPEAIDILNMVKSGELSAEEGAARLQALETRAGDQNTLASDVASNVKEVVADQPGGQLSTVEQIQKPPEEELLPDFGWWKKGWLLPFWAGTAILTLSALWMGSAFTSRNFFWFYCSWLPMAFGVLVLFLSWWSQQARWVHVRVKDADGTRVAISLPLPLDLVGRLLHLFGRFIPNMDQQVLENLPEILAAMAKDKGQTSVEVDEKDGTRVRVYIV
jgi:hypothetical protein